MRPELLDRPASAYRLTELDFVKSQELAEALTKSHAFRIEAELAGLRDNPDQTAAEIVDDIAYYANLEISYVWAYTLWRLQAVFEGIISQSLLPRSAKPTIGFAAKLKALKAAGFALSSEDERALVEWSRVRNRLSHLPEWYYHAVWIQREDIQEYATLVLRILGGWKGDGGVPVHLGTGDS
jgi:hypothetical protein